MIFITLFTGMFSGVYEVISFVMITFKAKKINKCFTK